MLRGHPLYDTRFKKSRICQLVYRRVLLMGRAVGVNNLCVLNKKVMQIHSLSSLILTTELDSWISKIHTINIFRL